MIAWAIGVAAPVVIAIVVVIVVLIVVTYLAFKSTEAQLQEREAVTERVEERIEEQVNDDDQIGTGTDPVPLRDPSFLRRVAELCIALAVLAENEEIFGRHPCAALPLYFPSETDIPVPAQLRKDAIGEHPQWFLQRREDPAHSRAWLGNPPDIVTKTGAKVPKWEVCYLSLTHLASIPAVVTSTTTRSLCYR